MEVKRTPLPGLLLIEPKTFSDDRGYFLETWNKARYEQAGVLGDFCQDNMSFSKKGVLRGLHLQNPNAQAKLISVAEGEVYDVVVDIRLGSPSFGKWFGIVLSAEKKNQLYVPMGFAHGFCVLSETAICTYKCTDYYNPKNEITLQWNDAAIGINWPVANPELSPKDRAGLALKQIPEHSLVGYK